MTAAEGRFETRREAVGYGLMVVAFRLHLRPLFRLGARLANAGLRSADARSQP